MFGIIYLITNLFVKSTAEFIDAFREYTDNERYRKIEENSLDRTYFDIKGQLRDCATNCRVGIRINEQGDEIIYQLIGKDYSGQYKDLRNLSKIKRDNNLKKNIEEAKKNNKTVAYMYKGNTYNLLHGYTKYIKTGNKLYDEDVNYVPTYKNKKKINIEEQKENIIPDDINVYYDLETKDEVVIKKIYISKMQVRNNKYLFIDDAYTYFFVSLKSGKIIRRTDNQIINDNNQNVENRNAISINDTENFIEKYNNYIEREGKNNIKEIKYNSKIYYIKYSMFGSDCKINSDNVSLKQISI